jgi:O-antigen/teichoic acid export membrane protein
MSAVAGTVRSFFSSSLIRSTGVYTVSRLIGSAIPFLMLPVLTRYLAPTDYGILAMFAVLVGLVSPFVGLNINGAIGVKYFDKENIDLPNYIGNCFLLLTLSTVLVSVFIWLFADPISHISAFPKEWLWAVILISAGQFVIRSLMMLWQVENKPLKYGIFQNSQTFMNLSLSIILVVGLGKNWQGRLEAQIVTIAIFSLSGFFLLYKNGWLKFSYNRAYLKSALKFGLPLIPHEIGAMLIIQTDRMFITNMVGVSDTGIYTVGFQVAYVIELFTYSFNLAYSPWLYKKLSENDDGMKIRIVKLTYLYFVLILVFAIAVSLFLPWFLSFFVGDAFQGASKFIIWFALGFAFSGMYYMVANYIFFSMKTSGLAWITFFTAMLNIVFNYFLIKQNGTVGAAQASALSFFISFVLTWVLSAKVYKMPWNLRKLIS